MNRTTFYRALVVSCAVAAAAACDNANTTNTAANRNTAGTTAPVTDTARADQRNDADHPPVALDGCLQKGTAGTYLLTRLNEPAHKDVGSSGPARAVEQEQLWLARNEYRIDPQHDVKVDDLVGKQVHVTGTLADRADLPTSREQADHDREHPTATTGGAKGADIKQGDLAKIDATAVTMLAESCGGKTAAHKPATKGATVKKSK
jgi:hypothetical protein